MKICGYKKSRQPLSAAMTEAAPIRQPLSGSPYQALAAHIIWMGTVDPALVAWLAHTLLHVG